MLNWMYYAYIYSYTSCKSDNEQIVIIAGPGKADISAVPNMYQTINSCYGKGVATVNT